MKLTRSGMKTRKCPGCGERGKLREILYGFPAGPPDEDIYILGGCTIFGNDYDIRCTACGWEGWKEYFPSAREVAVGGCTIFGNDYDIRCTACGWEGWKEYFPTAREVAEGKWVPEIRN